MDSISVKDSAWDSRFFSDVTIKGQKVRALVDAGATRTYLGPIFQLILEKFLIPVSATVLLAKSSVEYVVDEVNTQFTLSKTRKAMPVRVVHSLIYDCILGIDFLKNFKLKIHFGKGTWKLPDSQVFKFDLGSNPDEEVIGECAGLAEMSNTQKKKMDRLIKQYIKAPGKKLSITSLAKHRIELLHTHTAKTEANVSGNVERDLKTC